MNWLDQSHRGDCRDLMRAMIADGVRVQTIVTSPPYWGLRSYLPGGHPDKGREIGSEPTLREFIDTLVGVFELCRQLLVDDGTLWLNMGDAYASSGGQTPMRGETFAGRARAKENICLSNRKAGIDGLKVKDLMGQGTTGHTGQASTIWKVVDWSKTSCGGRQYDLLADAEPATACSSAYGLCE